MIVTAPQRQWPVSPDVEGLTGEVWPGPTVVDSMWTPPEIDAVLCKGCGMCIKACPVGAISGEKKQAHRIDQEVCVKCGACITICKLTAVA